MGYSYFEDTKERHKRRLLNEMTKEAYKNNRLWFDLKQVLMTQDTQTEDLGDNAMRA
jgi:hypothetical protein